MVLCLPTTSLHKRDAEGNSTVFISTTPTLLESCDFRSYYSCKTLPQFLCQESRAYQSVFRTKSLPIYFYFVHPELYYDHNNFDKTQSTDALETHRCNCIALTDILNQNVVSEGACSWNYTCTYNPDEFPAFTIEAGACIRDANLGQLVGDGWKCKSVWQSVKIMSRDNGQCWNGIAIRSVKIGCQLAYEQ